MYLVMGITGKVGGATARHLLKQGKQVRALVRNREKAAKWADQGVELVDGDWNDATAIAAALKGVEGAFVMLPTGLPATNRSLHSTESGLRSSSEISAQNPSRAYAQQKSTGLAGVFFEPTTSSNCRPAFAGAIRPDA